MSARIIVLNGVGSVGKSSIAKALQTISAAPLDVLEAREHARGDRLIGLARCQYGRVHRGMIYDLEIDTAVASALECARKIKATFNL